MNQIKIGGFVCMLLSCCMRYRQTIYRKKRAVINFVYE